MKSTKKICVNSTCKKKARYSSLSWLPAVLIAILPKCPFCIMAYSGAMSMCSGKMLFPNADTYSGYFIVGISLIVILGILLNFKGPKTWWAVSFALFGSVIIAISQFITLSEHIYYTGVLMLFFGIWLNGSFTHFYHKYFTKTFKTSPNIN